MHFPSVCKVHSHTHIHKSDNIKGIHSVTIYCIKLFKTTIDNIIAKQVVLKGTAPKIRVMLVQVFGVNKRLFREVNEVLS